MSYRIPALSKQGVFDSLCLNYRIFAPKRFPKQGRFSDTDIIRYAEVHSFDEIVFDQKSDYPAKEVITPIQQAIFYFTEEEFRASTQKQKPILLFARACDINAQRIQARIYAGNGGFEDYYYTRQRALVTFALMECSGDDDTCFCASMGSNKTDDYAIACKQEPSGDLLVEVKDVGFARYFTDGEPCEYHVHFVEENELKVSPPVIEDKETLLKLKQHPMWKEFDSRCISCGSCTVACSTCTCFTTRDVIYGDNPEVGERRRVTSSCQIDGFADMAGGHTFRTTAGERMRYKMLHKFHDYKARFGEEHMCVGCGRCTSRCPEFISISATVGKMNAALSEIRAGKE